MEARSVKVNDDRRYTAMPSNIKVTHNVVAVPTWR